MATYQRRTKHFARSSDPATQVPSELVRWAIKRWMRENHVKHLSTVSMTVFGTRDSGFLGKLMQGMTSRVAFDHVDYIFCRLGIMWTDHPKLWRAYTRIDLRALDFAHPTTPRRRAICKRYLTGVWKTDGNRSVRRTAALTGLSIRRVQAFVPTSRQRQHRAA